MESLGPLPGSTIFQCGIKSQCKTNANVFIISYSHFVSPFSISLVEFKKPTNQIDVVYSLGCNEMLLKSGPQGKRYVIVFTASQNYTVFKNHRKSLIQHYERSELRLQFEWTKSSLKMPKMFHFGEVFENLKLAVKQCYQTGQFFNRTKIGGKCQN